MTKLNPLWKSHNDLYNEGGEGFNPHPKYITVAQAPAVGVSRFIAGKRRTHAEAVKFANSCLSGAQKASFMSEVKTAFPENY